MNRYIRNKPGNPFQERDIRQNKIASFAKGRNHTWHCSQPIRIQNRIRCSHELCYLCFQVHMHICSPKQNRSSGKPRRLHHIFKNSNRASCSIQVGGPIIGHILPWWLDWWKNPNVAITNKLKAGGNHKLSKLAPCLKEGSKEHHCQCKGSLNLSTFNSHNHTSTYKLSHLKTYNFHPLILRLLAIFKLCRKWKIPIETFCIKLGPVCTFIYIKKEIFLTNGTIKATRTTGSNSILLQGSITRFLQQPVTILMLQTRRSIQYHG